MIRIAVQTLLLVLMLCFSMKAQPPGCSDTFIYSDVLFAVDNSGSITDAEYADFEAIMVQTINKVRANCPTANIGIVHYGGDLGDSTIVTYNFGDTTPIGSVGRQFCVSNPVGTCVSGDDLNSVIGDIMTFFGNGTLSLTPGNRLSLVIMTDAFGGEVGPCDFVNCSAIRPYTNIDILKASYAANVLVVGVEPDADAVELAPYASVGGTYTGSLDGGCVGTFDGCILPRQYIPIQFADDVAMASDSIANSVQCQVIMIPGIGVSAGADTTICDDGSGIANLLASPMGGTAPFTYEWDNGLGFGASKNVSPTNPTTYTVTITDANLCTSTDQVTVSTTSCAPNCDDDFIYSDILFLIDNSGSITDAEYADFESIMVMTVNKVQASCPSANIAVVHYGGDLGDSTIIERDFSNAPGITDINRQFCVSNPIGTCVSGDDLNSAMGNLITHFQNGDLNRVPQNRLSIVVFTDAFGGEEGPCDLINCSAIRPYTNVGILKTTYEANVLVVGVEPDADAVELAPYASIGGSYTGMLNGDCAGAVDGCATPRQYIPIQFSDDIQMASDSISKAVQCTVVILPKVAVDAGSDQTICENLGQSATISATATIGLAPYTYEWSHGLGFGQTKNVSPLSTTEYFVTVTDANTCTAVDSVTIIVNTCDDCIADASDPLPPKEICLTNGSAQLYTDGNIGVVIPSGFEETFFLTDENLTIIDFRIGKGNFTVFDPGLYRIHTLIAEVNNKNDEDYIDLSIIHIGSSNLFTILNCIEQHGVCADFDLPGRVNLVLGPEEMMCMSFENSINLCSDGIDNDGDGLVDCLDNDCHDLINCLENTLLACNDLFDNDNDGLVDCNDPDCHEFIKCYERGDQCGDGIDNDGDGLIDCEDDSCSGSAECEESSPFTCIDGKDNDGDGLIDCQEPSCRQYLVCAEYSVAACTDGIDNDFDGLVDCADMDCQKVYAVVCSWAENTNALCSDGIDNDGDGLVDCDDPQCGFINLQNLQSQLASYIQVSDATCPNNENGVIGITLPSTGLSYVYSLDGTNFSDNSLFVDLSPGQYEVFIGTSSECTVSTVVQVGKELCAEICNNNKDDDNDGLTDCADADCGVVQLSSPIVSDANCPDNDDGHFMVSFGTGSSSGPVEYSIDGFNYKTIGFFKDLTPGVYNVRVRNAHGCSTNIDVWVGGKQIPEINKIAAIDASCPDNDNGSLMITMQGQSGGYVYSIDGGNSFQQSGLFNNLPVGTYDIVVVSDDGCKVESSAVISGMQCVEICDNGIDDDGNGLTDCDDPYCGFDVEGQHHFQLDEITGKDASVGSSTRYLDRNFGGESYLNTSAWTDFAHNSPEQNFRTFIDIPIDQTLTTETGTLEEAVLSLSYDPTFSEPNGGQFGENAVTIHLLTQEWVEDEVTWNTQPTYFESPFVEIPQNNDYSQIEVNIKPLLAKVLDDDLTFYGFILKQKEETPYSRMVFASREHESQNGPSLQLVFQDDYIKTDATCSDPGSVEILKAEEGWQFSLDGQNYQESPTFNDLAQGTYTAYISNLAGCIKVINFNINKPNCVELCDNGIDDDGDGMIDCQDNDCGLIMDGPGFELLTQDASCPSNKNGSVEVVNPYDSVEYSLDNEVFSTTGYFDSLSPGPYTIYIRNMKGCDQSLDFEILGENCPEICGNGLDDDGDGMIDCEDLECGVSTDSLPIGTIIIDATCPSNDNGGFEVINVQAGFSFSIDDSLYQPEPVFVGLSPGIYTLFIVNDNNCKEEMQVEIEGDLCVELCDNGIDDDNDGLIDCDDFDCELESNCGSSVISSNLTVFLQGAYLPEQGKMTTELNESGYLPGQLPATFFGTQTPSGQPYSSAPWFYEGKENVKVNKSGLGGAQYDPEVVDWVLISLRLDPSKESQVWMGAALLYNDGYVMPLNEIDLKSKEGSAYYVVIEHRNHLPVMSRSKVVLKNGHLEYDFSREDSFTSPIGVGQVQAEDGKYTMIAGNGELIVELSSDIDINSRDFNCWLQGNGLNSSYFLEDYDMNGDINIKDRIIWELNNGLFSTISTK